MRRLYTTLRYFFFSSTKTVPSCAARAVAYRVVQQDGAQLPQFVRVARERYALLYLRTQAQARLKGHALKGQRLAAGQAAQVQGLRLRGDVLRARQLQQLRYQRRHALVLVADALGQVICQKEHKRQRRARP